jgi:hypothetical protein
MAVRSTARRSCALQLNHRQYLLLVIEFLKPLSEMRPLAQREARHLFYQSVESLCIHGYFQADSQFTLFLWGENFTLNGEICIEKPHSVALVAKALFETRRETDCISVRQKITIFCS